MMTSTTSNNPLRKQAAASIDAAATEIQHGARQELESLRSSINARLTALEKALSREPDEPAFNAIVEKLCAVAEEHAEAASTFTRAEAEVAAAAQLTAVRAKAQAELEATHAASEATRLELEERLAKADASATETARALLDLRARTDAARLESEQRLARSEAARLEGEQRLAQSEAERLEAAVTMAETERAAAVARQDAEAAAALLEEARTQITALEGTRGDLTLARDIAEAHLEGEVHHRNVIEAELQAAREKALHAKADADACRLELQRAAARIRAFEEQHRHLNGSEDPTTTSIDAAMVVGQVRSALQKLAGAGTGRALLDAALESLSENFSRVALCAVAPQGCTVWGSRGFETPLESRKGMMPLPADSPMARALADWKPVAVHAADGEPRVGVSGSPIAFAIALPIVAQDRATVMLYAENPPESSSGDSRVAEKIAEILVDHLAQRLRPRKAATAAVEPPAHVPARQARRVKLQEGTDVAVDGARATLVDLSTRGAQVLSPRAVKPNSSVRLQVPTEAGALSCEARVVWVLVEKRQDHKHALYRAGVQFTDIAAPEFEAFFSQHGVLDNAIRH